ncbi:MAG: osmoprotectant NAGGN system M42 family peptidase [Planctomycetota bacterium]|nr:MAG: osmoprotectant NAGGN system M42 family peptidase [Planctomycetota bacterium]
MTAAALPINRDYIRDLMVEFLNIPSPSGYTDAVVRRAVAECERLGVSYELTRRGAIRVLMPGQKESPKRAIAAHLDTLGAMVKNIKDNGRLEVTRIGYWAARFAEGARVTIFTDKGSRRGTILPLKASGHTFNDEIDTQISAWENLEIRVDEPCDSKRQLELLGFNVGDYVAIDPGTEVSPNGFINSRHLDDKAGVAALFGTIRAMREGDITPAVDSYFLFTISEEVGSGASAVLHGDVAEMVSVDNGTPAPGQNSSELGVTISMMDSTGPFDYHLTHRLLELCRNNGIAHQRDVFRYYRSDLATAVEAGNDIRTALVCFGVDASHGWERIHLDSLAGIASLLTAYLQSPPTTWRDRLRMNPDLEGLPQQPGADNPAPPIFTH